MTPAEELAAAADKLDALAMGATDGPWIVERSEDHLEGRVSHSLLGIERWRGLSNDVQLGEDEATAAYIAALNPLVGKGLAEMLRRFAEAVERKWRVFHEMWKTEQRVRMCAEEMPGLHEALAIARLINGSGS